MVLVDGNQMFNRPVSAALVPALAFGPLPPVPRLWAWKQQRIVDWAISAACLFVAAESSLGIDLANSGRHPIQASSHVCSSAGLGSRTCMTHQTRSLP